MRFTTLLFLHLVLLLSNCSPSAAELERYRALDETLQPLNAAAWRATYLTLKGVEAKTEMSRFQPQDVALLQQAQAQHIRTALLLATLDSMRHVLLQATGNQQRLVELDAHRTVTQLLFEHQAAIGLQQKLTMYARSFQVPAHGLPVLFRTPAHLQQLYHNAPVVAVLVWLSQAKAEVLRVHAASLQPIAAKVGGNADFLVQPFASAVAETRTIPAGDTYRATLFLSYSLPSTVLERMTVNGQPIARDRLGRGKVSFSVPCSAIGKADSVTAHWTGTIRVLIGTRSDSFTIRVPYIIVNPLNQSEK